MSLKSTFGSDLQKEQSLFPLLDSCYKKHLKFYGFERIADLGQQLQGIDLILTRKSTGERFFVDEKAQLDYINEDLPTFAFELCYEKNGQLKNGWLFDTDKKTDFYALITGIYSDEFNEFTSCKITFLNRAKLIAFLNTRNVSRKTLRNSIEESRTTKGKMELNELNHSSEGYLYFSSHNKAEKPINLVLKLDFLIEQNIAKRFV